MPVEVILMSDVKDLGAQGAVVRVADGFARNYLIPRKLAAPVNEGTRRKLAKLQRDRVEEDRKVLDRARTQAGLLNKASREGLFTIRAKAGAGEADALYGSVTITDIAAILAENKFDVDKNHIGLAEPIKVLGSYDIPVKLHAEVECTIKVWVVEDK
jgi:large subunit ribosomal protein L9